MTSTVKDTTQRKGIPYDEKVQDAIDSLEIAVALFEQIYLDSRNEQNWNNMMIKTRAALELQHAVNQDMLAVLWAILGPGYNHYSETYPHDDENKERRCS